MLRWCIALCALLLFTPPAAHAAAPPNDLRTGAERVTLPASVTGTTADSTLEAEEPRSCARLRGSVFYEFTAPSSAAVVVRLRATGDLDAVVDVLQRTRS